MTIVQPLITLTGVGITYRNSTSLFKTEKFCALHDIDLDIMPGETLGIIGTNGSGKSSLLKLLARIYQPDEGTAIFRARRISLLSLALGFDVQLSGYDNAIVSSMLLGASHSEALALLDDIIRFSELGDFARRPVKTYSSGMKARLGFSVALKMHTDVLLIDEALAVGDAKFKKKSEQAITKKMSTTQTVVLVSHSVGKIARLCSRALWLEQGEIIASGEPRIVIDKYQHYIDNAPIVAS